MINPKFEKHGENILQKGKHEYDPERSSRAQNSNQAFDGQVNCHEKEREEIIKTMSMMWNQIAAAQLMLLISMNYICEFGGVELES